MSINFNNAFACHDCYELFMKKYNLECGANCDYIKARQILKQIYLKNHPDKGGDTNTFIEIYKCGKKLIDEGCKAKDDFKTRENIECELNIQPQIRTGYTVEPRCIKTRAKDKFYDERCPIGSYYRHKYTVPPKCGPVAGTGLEGVERKQAQENYYKEFLDKAIEQQKFLLGHVFGWVYSPEKIHRFMKDDIDSIDKRIFDTAWYLNKRYNYFDYELDYISVRIPRKKPFKNSDFKELLYAEKIRLPGFLLGESELDGINYYIEWYGYYEYMGLRSSIINNTTKKKKDCEGGEMNRSPKTNLCLKPCKETQSRNPATNRCKKISK